VTNILKSVLLFLLLSFGFNNHFLSQDTIYVCSACETKTITSALNNVNSGGTIIVKEGVYLEKTLIIKKPVNLIGINYPVIDGKNQKKELIVIASDSVSIDGFQIQNVGHSYIEDLAGVRVQRKKYFSITNNIFYNAMYAIYLEYCGNGIVSNNKIIGNAKNEVSSGNGIHAWYCKNLHIENNHIEKHRDGIYFEFVKNSTIIGNISKNNLRYGLHFMFSNNDNYYDNEFINNGAGVAVMFSKEIEMYRNVFADNWGSSSYGLLLKEINDAKIMHNTFTKNTIGIRVEGANRIDYLQNNFIGNGWGIKISGGCYTNKINKNNFIANSFDLSLQSSSNDNNFDGNYWSSYSGYDLNRDKIGDIPYRPVKMFNYIVNRTPETMVLLRSLFIDIINFSEKVSPVFTPVNVFDSKPYMKKIIF